MFGYLVGRPVKVLDLFNNQVSRHSVALTDDSGFVGFTDADDHNDVGGAAEADDTLYPALIEAFHGAAVEALGDDGKHEILAGECCGYHSNQVR